MGRDGEVKQRQHFYHHGDTLCHPKSGYVTTKLHGTSICRCNNNAIFSDREFSRFLPAPYPSHVNLAAVHKALPVGAKVARWQRRSVEFIIFRVCKFVSA